MRFIITMIHRLKSPKAIILDIEGTTTPINFVHETLFGYIRRSLRHGWLKDHWQDEEVVESVRLLSEERTSGDIDITNAFFEEEVLKYVEHLMDQDVKSYGLKKLQGIIMREGYQDGSIKSVLFEDAGTRIKSWKESGHSIYIYSSGSITAQKLLFKFTERGDLTDYIDGYFDTSVGSKILPISYKKILSQISCCAEDVLFLSDNIKEIRAAVEAGLPSLLVVRPGNVPVGNDEIEEINKIHTFEDIVFVTN